MLPSVAVAFLGVETELVLMIVGRCAHLLKAQPTLDQHHVYQPGRNCGTGAEQPVPRPHGNGLPQESPSRSNQGCGGTGENKLNNVAALHIQTTRTFQPGQMQQLVGLLERSVCLQRVLPKLAMDVFDYTLVRASEQSLEQRAVPVSRRWLALRPVQAERMRDNNYATLYLSSMGVSVPFKCAFQEQQRDGKYWLFRRASEMQRLPASAPSFYAAVKGSTAVAPPTRFHRHQSTACLSLCCYLAAALPGGPSNEAPP